jgi:ankyrin repeat protein
LNRVSARQSAGIHECARLLLDRGASPNTVVMSDQGDPESRMPALRRAMLSANMPVMMLLLQRGADRDPLSWTTPFATQNPRMIEAFGEYFGMPQVQEKVQEQLRQRFKDLKGTPDQWSPGQWWLHMRPPETPPMATPMLRSLLESGALDPNRVGADGLAMIHRAALRGPVEVAELLLAHGADLHRETPDGKTPLVLATRAGQNLIVDVLRAHGATIAGLSPFDEFIGACMRVDRTEARRLLDSHPALLVASAVEDAELLVRTAAANILPRAGLMLECGFDPARCGEGGFTPLHIASWHGHVEMVQLLLKHHAPLDVRDATYGSSPVAWAAHGSRNSTNADEAYRRILTALFEAGAHYECGVSRAGVRPEDLASESVAGFLREAKGNGTP